MENQEIFEQSVMPWLFEEAYRWLINSKEGNKPYRVDALKRWIQKVNLPIQSLNCEISPEKVFHDLEERFEREAIDKKIKKEQRNQQLFRSEQRFYHTISVPTGEYRKVVEINHRIGNQESYEWAYTFKSLRLFEDLAKFLCDVVSQVDNEKRQANENEANEKKDMVTPNRCYYHFNIGIDKDKFHHDFSLAISHSLRNLNPSYIEPYFLDKFTETNGGESEDNESILFYCPDKIEKGYEMLTDIWHKRKKHNELQDRFASIKPIVKKRLQVHGKINPKLSDLILE